MAHTQFVVRDVFASTVMSFRPIQKLAVIPPQRAPATYAVSAALRRDARSPDRPAPAATEAQPSRAAAQSVEFTLRPKQDVLLGGDIQPGGQAAE